MKTTVEIDPEKVRRLKNWTGLRTCRAVVDYALTEAARTARRQALFKNLLPPEAFKNAVDPGYNLIMRQSDRIIRQNV